MTNKDHAKRIIKRLTSRPFIGTDGYYDKHKDNELMVSTVADYLDSEFKMESYTPKVKSIRQIKSDFKKLNELDG